MATEGADAGTRPRRLAILLALLLVAPLAAGCAGGTDHDNVSAVLVQGKPGFQPARVVVHTGDKVSLQVRNLTEKAHGFDIDGYGLKARVVEPASAPLHVRFTASRPGTFRIFCQLHPTHQTATLVVL